MKNSSIYNTNIRGIPVCFASAANINPKRMAFFADNQLSTEIGTNEHYQDVLLRLSPNGQPTTELQNKVFTEFMWITSNILHSYNIITERSGTSPEITRPTFKTKTKETAFDKHWKHNLDKLIAFKQQYGHCNVSRTTPGHTQLGNWLTDQRRKKRSGKLTKDQYCMLTMVGVEWERTNRHISISTKVFVADKSG
mmetsp:Transcript_19097/g.26718  ORF Transcript_19097/g.26718 Transcript_19097/m.26718 type:complete len:195 (+) Transcript_19097:87-671(+)